MPHSIRTDRLLLRPLSIRDMEAFYHAHNDYDVVKMTATWSWPLTEPYVLSRIKEAVARQDGPRAVFGIVADNDCDSNAGKIIGSIGGGPSKEDGQTASVGYMLGKEHWGRGYALEALNGWCAHMLHTYKYKSIAGEHWVDNPASGRVMAKAGFDYVGPVAPLWCKARQIMMPGVRYRLSRP